jgi:GcrA cell cycle regulator
MQLGFSPTSEGPHLLIQKIEADTAVLDIPEENPPFRWTPENVAIMTEMLAKGRTSRHVSDVIGCSRNAVIGKALRLKIPRNRKQGASQPRSKARAAHPETQAAEPKAKYLDRVGIQNARRERDAAGLPPTPRPYTPQIASGIPPIPLRLSLEELTDKTCRWPIGDVHQEGFGFCGTERTHGSYCGYHARIAYQPRAQS